MKREQQDSIHVLWDELADFDAAHADEGLTYPGHVRCSARADVTGTPS